MNEPPNLACPAEEMAQKVVREERLELSRIAPLDPKSSAYANFATLAEKRATYCKAMNLTQLRVVGKRKSSLPEGCNTGFFPMGKELFSLIFLVCLLRTSQKVGHSFRKMRIVPLRNRETGASFKKGPSEDVPAGLVRGMRMTTRRKAVSSASSSWDRKA